MSHEVGVDTVPPKVTSCLWYRAVLRGSRIATRQVPMIRESFAEAVGAAGWPDGACLFLSGRQDTVFFSPVAIAAVPHLIAVCAAEPSLPPDRAGATLLVGDQSDWELLPRECH